MAACLTSSFTAIAIEKSATSPQNAAGHLSQNNLKAYALTYAKDGLHRAGFCVSR